MDTKKLVAIATTYARAAVPSVVALYAAGVTDPKTLEKPPFRYLNLPDGGLFSI